MATIRPFNAIRPKKGMEHLIAALPYDVYNRQEAKEVVSNNPESFLGIDRAETGFSDDVSTYDPKVYDRARDMIAERIADGRFVKDEAAMYYLYELTMDGRSQTGLVACASIDDYLNNIILKHENTRADKEEDRIRHVDVTNTQTGPIFLAYRQNDEIKAIIAQIKAGACDADFTSEDGIKHRTWIVSDASMVEKLSDSFAKVANLYIADGHHRCASAVKVGLRRREQNPGFTGDEEFNYFLSVIFPDEELKILDYNRVVKDLNGLTKEEFLDKISEKFDVAVAENAPYAPAKKAEFGMYLDNTWYKLTAKQSILSDDAVEGLDVSILQNELLGPVLGIGDPKTDKRIDFVGGIRGLKELERRCSLDMTLAFSMYPTSIGELFAVADAHRLMPPKSTWFEPKLRSGLFLHELN